MVRNLIVIISVNGNAIWVHVLMMTSIVQLVVVDSIDIFVHKYAKRSDRIVIILVIICATIRSLVLTFPVINPWRSVVHAVVERK